MNGYLANLKHKILGGRRDQRVAVRDAGFTDEAEAAAWATTALDQARIPPNESVQADLTGRTVMYILGQMTVRSTD